MDTNIDYFYTNRRASLEVINMYKINPFINISCVKHLLRNTKVTTNVMHTIDMKR